MLQKQAQQATETTPLRRYFSALLRRLLPGKQRAEEHRSPGVAEVTAEAARCNLELLHLCTMVQRTVEFDPALCARLFSEAARLKRHQQTLARLRPRR
jgi:hypothetical protein